MRRIALGVALTAAVAVAVLSALPASGRSVSPRFVKVKNRYALVHGCYYVQVRRGPRLGPFRMQAAALGQYLLYGAAQSYLGSGLQMTSSPGPSTVWAITGHGRRLTMTNSASGQRTQVSFARASGCLVYPEAQVDATGTPSRGSSPAAGVLGTVEGHAHVTAFELFGGDWHCGRPWSPYGAPDALPASCAADEQGTNGEVEAFLDFGGPTRPSDMHGWPTFVDWPSPTAIAEEGDYYTGIERAWKAGLRLMVTNLVDNEALCSIMSTHQHACNDMVSVHLQSRDLFALQNYIDAQSGGPGKGFFRVVTDPFQARKVINQGKLAVIEGIEVSRLFGCGERDNVPQCDQAQVDAGLREVEHLGVRTFFPVHEFDNAFGGTKGISGEQGEIVNAGNRLETGSYMTMQPCSAQDQDAEQLTSPPAGTLASLLNGPLSSLLGGNPAPVYGAGPQCNTRGLTSLGTYLIGQMAKQHIIVQLDHMDSKTASAALAVAESHHYPGVVSAHCCGSYQLNPRIYRLGGFVNPQKDQPAAFSSVYQTDRSERSPAYAFGFGYGSDMNGLSDQPGPLVGSPISYPFKSFDGRVSFTQERWGQRVFNLNTDGVANYGLYADWLHAVQQDAGPAITKDMFQGAEAYLEMWERAYGVRAQSCLAPSGRVTSQGVGPIHLGQSFKRVLYAAGQPLSRPGRSYRYCVRTGHQLSVVFNRHGRVAMVLTNAPGYRPGRVPKARLVRVRLRGARWVGVTGARGRALRADFRAA